jgi:membrane-associated phospholipid phosphatase
MARSSVARSKGRRSDARDQARSWRQVPREIGVVVSGVLCYFLVRGVTDESVPVAVRHAHSILSVETEWGINCEQWFQDRVGDSASLTTLMNWIYIWGHWPVIAVTLLWLVLDHPAGYRVTRDAMLLSGAVALVVFAVYPVAPPRLAGLGMVDTITTYSRSYRLFQPHAFVNQYAAVPSLHVGWDLLIGIALVTYGRHMLLRLIGVLLPLLMAVSVVATANHYAFDVAAGVALVLACHWIVIRHHSTQRQPGGRQLRTAGPSAGPDATRPTDLATP